MRRIVLISGMPSVGKSGLIENAPPDTLAIDMEQSAKSRKFGFNQVNGLRKAWDDFVASRNNTFFDILNNIPQKQVLLEWGFPLHCLGLVKRLTENGASAWWLEADEEAARKVHRAAKKSMPAFEAQVKAIRENSMKLSQLYAGKSLLRLTPDGKFLPKEEVFRRIFETE